MTISTAWLDMPHPERAMAFTRTCCTQFCLYAVHEGARPDEEVVFVKPIAFKEARAGGWGLHFKTKGLSYEAGHLSKYLNFNYPRGVSALLFSQD